MKIVLQLLYQIRAIALRTLKLKTRGAKAMVFNEAGELLLIRNSYGPRRRQFVLPGGGIGRRESPAEAAMREVREETGLAVEQLTAVSIHASNAEGKRDTIHLFTGRAIGAPTSDNAEIEEAHFFPLDALPDNISDATLRRIAEYRGEREPDGRW